MTFLPPYTLKSIPRIFRHCSWYYTSRADTDSRLCETLYGAQATKYTDREPPKLRRNALGLNSIVIQANLLIRVGSRAVGDIRRERQTGPHIGISIQRYIAIHMMLEALIGRRNAITGTSVRGAIDPLLSLAQVIVRGVKASYRRWIRSRMEV
jgi:hypothetical protein